MKAVYESRRDTDNEIRCFYNTQAWKTHFHSNVEIIYALSDNVSVTINGETFILTKNHFCVADSFDTHGNEKADIFVALIPLSYLENWNKTKKGTTLRKKIFYDEDNVVLNIMKKLEGSLSKNQLIKQGYVDLLLGTILEKTSLSREKFQNVSTLAREIVMYINNNFRKKISLDTLSRDLGYSKSHISHVFNEELKVNLSEYVNSVRVKKFVEQLQLVKDKEKTISLALDSGFSSLQTFYRAFKKEYDTTPYDYYKKNYKQNQHFSY